ncbi:MAG: DUF5337 domain-containing protein [Rhodobacteraceae bacterium]|uniref:DUF5337 domain-containing protein n=1 Tax=Celeribacter sp. HF31 TaxID=2721558 RepID=UPI0014306776|nr:DUF5337 domain-containing protein [Celeribacter sp. HF31]NIY80297.1 DUF5337 domain-containing protein [Celeribacter sp. HF31]NVK46182.1 DUF5337 domain-containing protein [Paracoccaceae bacterium]
MVPDKDQHLAKKARMVAVVIAVTMLVWLGAQWLGGKLGLPSRYAFLLDLAALAGFVWSFVVMYQIWRDTRRKD